MKPLWLHVVAVVAKAAASRATRDKKEQQQEELSKELVDLLLWLVFFFWLLMVNFTFILLPAQTGTLLIDLHFYKLLLVPVQRFKLFLYI